MLLTACAALGAILLVAAVLGWQHLTPAGVRYLSAFDNGGPAAVNQVRATLEYNVIVTTATILTTAVLALLVRRPLPWVRRVTWCALGAVGVLLFLGLNAGADLAGSTPDADATPAERLYYDLLPRWYPSSTAVLGLVLLVAGLAAAVMLTRSSVADYYRPASRRSDPRWASFVQAQKKRIAGDD